MIPWSTSCGRLPNYLYLVDHLFPLFFHCSFSIFSLSKHETVSLLLNYSIPKRDTVNSPVGTWMDLAHEYHRLYNASFLTGNQVRHQTPFSFGFLTPTSFPPFSCEVVLKQDWNLGFIKIQYPDTNKMSNFRRNPIAVHHSMGKNLP